MEIAILIVAAVIIVALLISRRFETVARLNKEPAQKELAHLLMFSADNSIDGSTPDSRIFVLFQRKGWDGPDIKQRIMHALSIVKIAGTSQTYNRACRIGRALIESIPNEGIPSSPPKQKKKSATQKSTLDNRNPNQKVSVDYTEWMQIEDFVAREYVFKNLAGPGTETSFQIKCTIQKGAFGRVMSFLHFVLHPAIQHKEGWLVARLSTMDGEEDSEAFQTLVTYQPDGSNIFGMIPDPASAKCRSILKIGRRMKLLVFDKQECVMDIPLENDLSFKEVYDRFYEQKLKQPDIDPIR